MQTDDTIPFGYCHCGCGQLAPLVRQNSPYRGYVKGQPHQFISNHHQRFRGPEYAIDPVTGCWNWKHRITKRGYGLARRNGKQVSAHRTIYEEMRGPIPEGLEPDHLCRNHACVNPDHLEPVTHIVNVQRGAKTKLKPDAVAFVLDQIGILTPAQLADRFGVSRSAIYTVLSKHGRTRARRRPR